MMTRIAKQVVLNDMRECNGQNCGCFTNKGYFIKYNSSNVDGMFFVCEDCYDSQYKGHCSVGSFNELDYIRTAHSERYKPINPVLSSYLRWFRIGVRGTRLATSVLAIVFIFVFCVKDPPTLRTEYCMTEIGQRINADFSNRINISIQSSEKAQERLTAVSNQFTKIFTYGGD